METVTSIARGMLMAYLSLILVDFQLKFDPTIVERQQTVIGASRCEENHRVRLTRAKL